MNEDDREWLASLRAERRDECRRIGIFYIPGGVVAVALSFTELARPGLLWVGLGLIVLGWVTWKAPGWWS